MGHTVQHYRLLLARVVIRVCVWIITYYVWSLSMPVHRSISNFPSYLTKSTWFSIKVSILLCILTTCKTWYDKPFATRIKSPLCKGRVIVIFTDASHSSKACVGSTIIYYFIISSNRFTTDIGKFESQLNRCVVLVDISRDRLGHLSVEYTLQIKLRHPPPRRRRPRHISSPHNCSPLPQTTTKSFHFASTSTVFG